MFGGYGIRPWALGRRPKELAQTFTSFKRAEVALIRHLKETDSVLGRAIYPGAPKRTKSYL